MGPAEIAAVANSIKVAFDLAKGTKAAIDALNNAEAKFKMAELYSALADAKVAMTDAIEAVAAKDREIERLRKSFQRSTENTVERQGFRYEINPDGEPRGRAFCPRRLEMDGVLIQIHEVDGPRLPSACPQCKTKYQMVSKFND